MTATTIETKMISVFKDAYQNEPDVEIPLLEYFDGIAIGRWKDIAERVRLAKTKGDKKEQDRLKKLANAVTIAGTFNKRNAANLREPSGLIAIDLDHLGADLMRIINLLKNDPYVLSVFRSIGGNGLCVVFRVDYTKWLESFEGIRIYLTDMHGVVTGWDESVKDVSRLRFVSYDPDIYVNYKAQLFRKYPRKEKKQEKPFKQFVPTKTNLDYILAQINSRNIDIAPGYNEWYKVGWALISQYGEGARELFHQVSQYNSNYDTDECDKKFKYLIDTRPAQITIATFYYYCKNTGIDIITPETKEIIRVAQNSKRNKVAKSSAFETVIKMMDVADEEARIIVDQVYSSDEAFDTGETIYQQAAFHIQTQHILFYNEISRRIEKQDGTILEGKRPLNNIYYELLNMFDGKLRWSDFERIIWSDVVPLFNPVRQFFNQNKELKPIGIIKSLAATIDTDTGWDNAEFDPTYVEYFLRKWLIGLVALAHGDLNDIMIVLTGPPNSGKTQFFRRLLPAELKRYYAETNLDRGKDDEILMCEYLLLMLDELASKAFHDSSTLKSTLSKDFFTLREPYGSGNVTLQRRATLCGTSNSREILNDPTGNRRVIPINVLAVDHVAYNAIDKTELLMEAYHAWKSGESYQMSKEDIVRLNENTTGFEKWSIERQLLERYFAKASGSSGENTESLQAIDIQIYLEQRANGRKLNEHKIKPELLAMGIVPYQKRLGRDPITRQQRRPYVYDIVKLTE